MTGYALPIGGALTFTGRQDRQSRAAHWTPGASGLQVTAGVRPGPGLDVTVASGTITVTPGAAVVQSAASVLAGPYNAWLDANFTATLTAADASNPRSDLVYLRVRDTDEDASTFRDCIPVYVAGTPGASPVTPSIPAGTSGVVLGVITVPKVGGGSPTVSYSARRYSVAVGGTAPMQSGLLAAGGVYIGQTRYNLVRGCEEWWNGSAWATPGDWTDYSPVWTGATTNPSLGTGGTLTGRYALVGKTCHVRIEMVVGTSFSVGSGQMFWSLPIPAYPAGTPPCEGTGHGITPGLRWDLNTMVIGSSTTQVMQISAPSTATSNGLQFLSSTFGMGGVTWASGHIVRGSITYETA